MSGRILTRHDGTFTIVGNQIYELPDKRKAFLRLYSSLDNYRNYYIALLIDDEEYYHKHSSTKLENVTHADATECFFDTKRWLEKKIQQAINGSTSTLKLNKKGKPELYLAKQSTKDSVINRIFDELFG